MDPADLPALQIVERARAWVREDARVRAALVHGSVAKRDVTPLSDVDLVVVAEPGRRESLWRERAAISARLLGEPAVEAHEVPHQRPYRWQARTADLHMLDLTVDEGAVDLWVGLTGEVEFLVDRGGVAAGREAALADFTPQTHDVPASCDTTWSLLSWMAGSLLHQRVWLVRTGLTDLVGRQILPAAGVAGYSLGSLGDPDDAAVTQAVDAALPTSLAPAELARSFAAIVDLYGDVLDGWAKRTGRPRPRSALEPAVRDVADRLVRGRGERLADPT